MKSFFRWRFCCKWKKNACRFFFFFCLYIGVPLRYKSNVKKTQFYWIKFYIVSITGSTIILSMRRHERSQNDRETTIKSTEKEKKKKRTQIKWTKKLARTNCFGIVYSSQSHWSYSNLRKHEPPLWSCKAVSTRSNLTKKKHFFYYRQRDTVYVCI